MPSDAVKFHWITYVIKTANQQIGSFSLDQNASKERTNIQQFWTEVTKYNSKLATRFTPNKQLKAANMPQINN